MKLKTAEVTNFRSAESAGKFSLDDITCLVGKNEAGKTAILQALAGLNPHKATPISYDVERDYPRRHLTDYEERHEDEEAVVVRTTWKLSEDEAAEVAAEFGPKALTSGVVTVLRRYNAKEPEWEIEVDTGAAVAHLVSDEKLDATERGGLSEARDAAL